MAFNWLGNLRCRRGVLLRQAGVYCIGAQRDELLVEVIAAAYAPTKVPAPQAFLQTAHVRTHIDALAVSGRQWQGEVAGWTKQESLEFSAGAEFAQGLLHGTP